MDADLGKHINNLGMANPEEVERSRRAILVMGTDAVGYLVTSYRSAESELVRCRILNLIGELIMHGAHLPDGFLDEIILRKDECSRHERATIYKELGVFLEEGANWKLFELGLMDAANRVRANAVEGIGVFLERFPYETAPVDLLEKLADDADARVRVNVRLVLHQIYEMKQRKLVEELKHIARYGDEEERAGANFALKRLGKLKLLPSMDDLRTLSIFRRINTR